MEWIALIGGVVVGGMVFDRVESAIILGLLGYVVTQSVMYRRLQRHSAELAEGLADFKRRFEQGTSAVVERLVALEQWRQNGKPSHEEQVPQEAAPEPAPLRSPASVASLEAASTEAIEAPSELEIDLSALEQEVAPQVAREQTRAPLPQEDTESVQPPAEPDFIDRVLAAGRNWLLGGNPVLRVGVVLLFLGLAFLLKYAAERVSVSVEMRYIGVALSALVLLALGWRLREREGAYGLILQGAGIAVMYLTIFAAMYLHPLLSMPVAFALLLAVTCCSAVLAVAQDSLPLAVAATIGGLATPLLTAINDQVPLFAYLLLLNIGVFAIAWRKAWRLLNLFSFVGTFAVGLTWGVRFYTPQSMLVTDAFLIAFFVLYVSIGLAFARRKLLEAPPVDGRTAQLRRALAQADYMDGTILFGPPLLGFGLQYAVLSHLEFGPAFSALVLGLFYMVLARLVQRRIGGQAPLLEEVYLALGVIFGTLAIPLGLDAHWTTASWAVEGAGIYWVGMRQRRTLARLFALLLQAGAAISYFTILRPGVDTLLSGPWLGALMLGTALLFSHYQLHRARLVKEAIFEGRVAPVLAVAGLGFLYLLPPLFFAADGTAASWALAGLLTLFAGLRLGALSYLFAALAVQLIGGVLFLLQVEPAATGASAAVLDAGWRGLLLASLIGFSIIAGVVFAMRNAMVRENVVLAHSTSVLLLFGLVLLNLAVLFVLPWRVASGVWAGSGLLIVWLSLQLQQRAGLVFGLIIQLVGGFAFLQYGGLGQRYVNADVTALAHAGFWTPAILALAAFAGAWRLWRVSVRGAECGISAEGLALVSKVLLGWGVLWWCLAAGTEIERFVPGDLRHSSLLLAAAGSVFVWTLLARRLQWRALAALALGLAPVALLLLLGALHRNYHPLAQLGWLAWPALMGVHLAAMRLLDDQFHARARSVAHVLGAWLIVAVLALELRYLLIMLSEQYNAWRWLGWAAVPSAYLLLMTQVRKLPWPIAAYGREYRAVAALPLAVLLLAWVWLAAMQSNGAAQPLPYLPLVNPLELSMMLALYAVFCWVQVHYAECGVPLALPPRVIEVTIGASVFALITSGVFRVMYHWAAIPYNLTAMLDSMLVQAILSLVWTSIALALMIVGHRLARRDVWIAGTVLIAVVVVKLLLIELGNHGGMERILSFIGVGVLLLVVGYFAPLPPRRQQQAVEGERA